MKILIGSPAYGGMVTSSYLKSLMAVMPVLQAEGHQVDLHMEECESLISRGRNTCATFALKNGYDKLLFIDTDLLFTVDNVKKLLASDKLLVGGTYPLKAHPITPNFNPLPEDRELFGDKRQQDNYMQWVHKYADPETGEAEVMHIPTGFMLIDTRILAKLTYVVPWYQTFSPDHGIKEQYYDFFPVRVVGHEFESEDWAFCSLARENGFKVYLQTQVICAHVGTMRYGLGQHIIVGQPPLIPRGGGK